MPIVRLKVGESVSVGSGPRVTLNEIDRGRGVLYVSDRVCQIVKYSIDGEPDFVLKGRMGIDSKSVADA